LFGIFIAVVLLIVYGSLYPWHFEFIRMPANPLWILLHAWGSHWDRRFAADVVINIALYVPLGMSGYLGFRRFRIVGPVVVGAVVSACVEMAQLYTDTRICSAFDLLNNILGSALGVALGMLLESVAGPELTTFGEHKVQDRRAAALLFCWVGALVFPLYPEMHLIALRADLRQFAHSPLFAALPFLSALASWFVAGLLLQSSGVRAASVWLGLSVLLLPAQFVIVSRQPTRVEFIGAFAGFLVFLVVGSRWGRAVAWGFLGLLVLRGLSPFQFGEAHPFLWIPFEGFLEMNWQTGIEVLLEKLFYYGAAVWLLRKSGMTLRMACGVVVVLLGCIEGLQSHLPGRTAEITDPLLGLLVGLGFRGLRPGERRRVRDGALPEFRGG
jgi:VanZ family protein